MKFKFIGLTMINSDKEYNIIIALNQIVAFATDANGKCHLTYNEGDKSVVVILKESMAQVQNKLSSLEDVECIF